ncbi:Tfp pilus assembly protein FimT/FimU [Polynucleobacter necessarius]|uniref:pilus assembly FimT family protein n=1 Tax=Polynucleobacter necessarius TaxID=576610 RepID=UPI001E2F27F3|nr:prepilin-type N-terminal cleavage/methylation domain-containing protein [Polynucleobacter necessarius]
MNKSRLSSSSHIQFQSGFSLLELMAAVLMIAIIVMMTMPLIHEQIAIREIEAIARRFIVHTHFARQQALYLGEPCAYCGSELGVWVDSEKWVHQTSSERVASPK